MSADTNDSSGSHIPSTPPNAQQPTGPAAPSVPPDTAAAQSTSPQSTSPHSASPHSTGAHTPEPRTTGPHSESPAHAPRPAGERVNLLARRIAMVLIFIGLLVIAYFVLKAFLPRWWAQRIGDRVNNSLGTGIWTGLTIGVVCTLVPIICFCLSIINRGRLRNVPAIAFAVVGLVVAIPNLLTLAVVVGHGNSAHAGERILDVDGPGFRAASAWGVGIGAVVALVICFYIWRYRHRGRQLATARSTVDQLQTTAEIPDEHASGSAASDRKRRRRPVR